MEQADRVRTATHTGNCHIGKRAGLFEHLRARLVIDPAAQRLARFFSASVDMMKIMARACGHTHLRELELRDLTTWKRDVAHLTGVAYGGVGPS